MCFSATASFAAAGVLMFWGVCNVCLLAYRSSLLNPLQKASLGLVAAIPLIFGAHQLSEGFVWNDFDNEPAVRCFAYTAYVVWPLLISLSFCLVEWTRRDDLPQPTGWSYWPGHWKVKRRQQVLSVHVVLAFALVAVVLWDMIRNDPNTVLASNGRLQYEGWGIDNRALALMGSVVYVYCVVGSLVVSSLRYSTLFGAMVFISLIISLVLWDSQFPSTWCFFAAILSSLVVLIVWNELSLYHRKEPETTAKSEIAMSEIIKPKKESGMEPYETV